MCAASCKLLIRNPATRNPANRHSLACIRPARAEVWASGRRPRRPARKAASAAAAASGSRSGA
eukprot:1822573-Alexandrium_andersonii.AAC.1